jgi:hypothetical protein
MTSLALGFLLWSATTVQPAQAARPHVPVETIAAQPEDVATIDGIVKAFYDVISGPAGQPRQWARDRTLYRPDVRFAAMSVRNGKPVARIMSHQQYVDGSDAGFVKNGFFETEIHRAIERFGNMAHVWSTYESRQTSGGPIAERGINSLQLYFDGARWWIAAVAWEDERPDAPIPGEYLKKQI